MDVQSRHSTGFCSTVEASLSSYNTSSALTHTLGICIFVFKVLLKPFKHQKHWKTFFLCFSRFNPFYHLTSINTEFDRDVCYKKRFQVSFRTVPGCSIWSSQKLNSRSSWARVCLWSTVATSLWGDVAKIYRVNHPVAHSKPSEHGRKRKDKDILAVGPCVHVNNRLCRKNVTVYILVCVLYVLLEATTRGLHLPQQQHHPIKMQVTVFKTPLMVLFHQKNSGSWTGSIRAYKDLGAF